MLGLLSRIARWAVATLMPTRIRLFRIPLGSLVLLLSIVAVFLAGGVAFLTPEIPDFAEVQAHYRPSHIEIRARDGVIVQRIRSQKLYWAEAWLPLSRVPQSTVQVLLSAEDRRFYSHIGFDPIALVRAAWTWVVGGHRSGASTVSMQLVRLLTEGTRPIRSPWARTAPTRLSKLSQMLGALALEVSWSKDQILEAYLNLIPLRGETRGIAAAAARLFQVRPEALSPAHALLTAALLPAPNASRTTVEARACATARTIFTRDPDETAKIALRSTYRAGFSEPDCAGLKELWGDSNRIDRHAHRKGDEPLSEAGARSILFLLKDELGHTTSLPSDVTTSLDRELQEVVHNLLLAHLSPLRTKHALDAAVLVVENRTGQVRSYVANSGVSASHKYVDGVRAARQAGSTLKPFIYAAAFEQNLITPESSLNDSPLEISVFSGLYRPANYDNRFRGPVTARVALASSLNIPALRTLTILGLRNTTETLSALHLVKPHADKRYGYSMALGAPAVSLWNLVNAYRTFANEGKYSPLTLSPSGQARTESLRIFSPHTAHTVSDILSDRGARDETFGLDSPLATSFWSAVKTGTSKDMTDNWCVGFSHDHTVGVWVGNFSGEPMRDVSGVSGAAPLWSKVLLWLHQNRSAPAERTASHSEQSEILPLAPATSRPARILAPSAGASIALDPGIPADHQAVLFRASVSTATLEWSLDGERIGAARTAKWWRPTKGSHVLALVDQSGRSADEVQFTVR